ncbi:MAG: glycosyltransferase family 39 protein [Actinobacteria bacterium]|nr:glycosyltransferase family 39 protein [Actinomycetota bacterium]
MARLEPIRHERSWIGNRVLWLLVGVTALAAGLRFSTLGLQSYRHDEAVTVGRVLVSSFSATMHRVTTSESTPPLYYALAWLWSRLFGEGEVGLRSLSALAGTATVPVAFLVGRELIGRRVGVVIATVVAVSPIMVWYSQDARAYALLVLLSTAALYFFLRGRHSGSARDLGWWAACSSLALATHYFAVFPLTIEAIMLLASTAPRRRVAAALAGVAATALALAPLALHQASGSNNKWISSFALTRRMQEAGIAAFVGENGQLKHALVPLAAYAAAVGLLVWRGGKTEKNAARLALAIGGGTIVLPLILAAFGQDYVLFRNLLPALIPLGLVAAAGIGAPRAGRLGLGVGAALIGSLLAFTIYVDFRPALQREDWRDVAARIAAAPPARRAIVSWEEGGQPLAYYLGRGAHEVQGRSWRKRPSAVREVDVVSGRPPPRRPGPLAPAFHEVGRVTIGRMTLVRYRAAEALPPRWKQLVGSFTGYANNVVVFQRPVN